MFYTDVETVTLSLVSAYTERKSPYVKKRLKRTLCLIFITELVSFISREAINKCMLFNAASSAGPHSTVSEDAGIEPRTVTSLALTARRFSHSVTSYHPQS